MIFLPCNALFNKRLDIGSSSFDRKFLLSTTLYVFHKSLPQPKQAATFRLGQIVKDCDMLQVMLLDFLDLHNKISQI